MTPDRWQRVKRLFHEALDRQPDERAAFLASECADEPSLADDVAGLLASDAQTRSFLEEAAALPETPSLSAGQVLASRYEIVDFIASGGMSEVYLAEDLEFGERVALKTVRFAGNGGDGHAIEHLRREIQLARKVTHPNVCRILELGFHREGPTDGVDNPRELTFLTMELVAGETLADKLSNGPLALPQGLEVCRGVALALEAAHDCAVIHRDVKPSNIKVTPEGTVKLLDFGLARLLELGGVLANRKGSGTRLLPASVGLILGTTAYMSPEQARGRSLDRRSDIWSFGCVLYETLSGRRAFEGETVSDSLAAVLSTEPDWARLPANVPPNIVTLVQRCLRKDRDQRLHDIADARIEIEDALQSSPPARGRLSSQRPWATPAAFVIGALVAGGAFWALGRPQRTGIRAPDARLSIHLPPEARPVNTLTVSPDGSRVAFSVVSGGSSRLFVRSLDSLESTPLPGTEHAVFPSFSPDGQWVAFGAEGQLKKVHLGGTEAETVCEAPSLRGVAWAPDDTLIFSPSWWSGLWRVSASGGTPRVLTTPNYSVNEASHRWPHVLPGGHWVIFSVLPLSGREEAQRADVLSLETGERRKLIEGATSPHYVGSGHLIYARAGSLLAQPFDLASLRPTGRELPMLDGLLSSPEMGLAFYDTSQSGVLAYVPGDMRPRSRRLVWADRQGHIESVADDARPFRNPVLSPDGRRLAVSIQGPHDEIWVLDLARRSWTRIASQGDNRRPRWSPDGNRIAFASNRNGAFHLYWTNADGTGEAEQLTDGPVLQFPTSFSPTGKTLAFEQQRHAGRDILLLQIGTRGPPEPLIATSHEDLDGRFSPDGSWLAYTSDESGRFEVYARAVSGEGPRWLVSSGGGQGPVWARDGHEIYYRNGELLMAVPVKRDPFRVGVPQLVLRASSPPEEEWADYDVTPDGKRFILSLANPGPQVRDQIVVLPNWLEELRLRFAQTLR
jgi:serine/threonine-protein kinase